jgi:hypothetical protein
MTIQQKLIDALAILAALDLPRAQQNERSALCLLAICDMTPNKSWKQAASPLIGITPIMDWARTHYQKDYAPNTRETVRRQTMHQFVEAGIALYNPDEPARPVNSSKAIYQISPEAMTLMQCYGTAKWDKALKEFSKIKASLAEGYAKRRNMNQVPVKLPGGREMRLSPGAHSELIKAIIEDFAPRHAPGSILAYVGDAGDKRGYLDEPLLKRLGVRIDSHGKMPDVVLHCPSKNWLILVESVTSHGPVDAKRHAELAKLFAGSKDGIVYVTAFPNRTTMARYLGEIAWETEVWAADAPTHMIHFNGERFLGPY